jgi:hypothetical protein
LTDSDPKEPERQGAGRTPSRKRQQKRPADLGTEFGDAYTVKVESKEPLIEIKARLLNEKAKLDHDLRKDFALFVVVMTIVVAATLACLFIVLSNHYPPTIQNAAMALLAAIVSGGVGYATGKSAK